MNAQNTARKSPSSPAKIKSSIKHRHRCDKCGTHFGTSRCLDKHVDDCCANKVTVTSTIPQSNCNTYHETLKTEKQQQSVHPPSKEPSTSSKKVQVCKTRNRRSSSKKKKKSNCNKPFACPDCDKRYSFAHGLRAHRLIHTGEKPHSCDECGKTFTQRSFLQIHTRTHTGEKPYECLKCGKHFRQPSHLRYHSVTHTRSTARGRFQCTVCGKRLRYQQSLRLHLRTAHAGDEGRPHKCEHCGKAFAERPKLRLHVRIHTGERPYACDLCGRSFAQKGNRDKHKERYHARDSDRKFHCDQCPKAFIWKKCLGMHLQWHRMASEESKKSEAVVWRSVNKDPNVVTSSGTDDDHLDDDEVDVINVDDDVGLLLQSSVSRLIPHLLDEEVLTEIGWPFVSIDQVVVKVLRWCDQLPVDDDNVSTHFERNVRTLLDIVLEEKFDEVPGLKGKTPHAIVEQLLKTIDENVS